MKSSGGGRSKVTEANEMVTKGVKEVISLSVLSFVLSVCGTDVGATCFVVGKRDVDITSLVVTATMEATSEDGGNVPNFDFVVKAVFNTKIDVTFR